jgi:hypothetical protein
VFSLVPRADSELSLICVDVKYTSHDGASTQSSLGIGHAPLLQPPLSHLATLLSQYLWLHLKQRLCSTRMTPIRPIVHRKAKMLLQKQEGLLLAI